MSATWSLGCRPRAGTRDTVRSSTRDESALIGMMFAGAICLAYLVIDPPSQDFASGHFRAELASRGVYLWNNLWFGGHPLPGFGMVSPVLGGVFGVVPVARDLGPRCDVVLRPDRREVARDASRAARSGGRRRAVRLRVRRQPLGWTAHVLACGDVRLDGDARPPTRANVAPGGVRSPVRSVVTVGSSVARRHPGRRVVRARRRRGGCS